MFKLKEGNVFACDVDSTLISWRIPDGYTGPIVETECNGFKDKGIPNLHVIDHIKKMKARNFSIIVWSRGGSDWAAAAVRALNLTDYVDIAMSKIDYHVDDVEDPSDKLGKWQFIDFNGEVFHKDKDGVIKKREASYVGQ